MAFYISDRDDEEEVYQCPSCGCYAMFDVGDGFECEECGYFEEDY